MISSHDDFDDFGPIFRRVQVCEPADVPPLDRRVIEIAVLDMHHGRPNLGHDSIIRGVAEIAAELRPLLLGAGIIVRTLSYDVRRSLAIPDPPGDRHLLYIGTGGPGHIDPRCNDGVAEGCQGIREDASWEPPLFELFDAIKGNRAAALLAVCHTFGILCRWAGVARPILRSPAKGGKSAGVVENSLTPEALRHPWFSRLSALPGDGGRLRVLDSRLFDLIPESGRFPSGTTPIAYESNTQDGSRGEAITMIEYDIDDGGIMPRIFAVNHHPEIRGRAPLLGMLESKLARGEVSQQWFDERIQSLDQIYATQDVEREILRTSHYTMMAPLRFHLYRQVRLRAAILGYNTPLHENQALTIPFPISGRDVKSPP